MPPRSVLFRIPSFLIALPHRLPNHLGLQKPCPGREFWA